MANYQIYSRPPKKRNPFLNYLKNLNVTGYIILFNILFFLIFLLIGVLNYEDCAQGTCKYIALQSDNLFIKGYVWTLLTSMFMHSGLFHLFVNMFSLFFIGGFLEMIIGRKRFFWLYLSSGIFAGLFFSILAFYFGVSPLGMKIFGSSQDYAVGASGAIFAIAGVLAFLTPKKKVYLILGPLIAIILEAVLGNFIKSQNVLSVLSFFITIYIFISLFSLISFNSSLRKISLPVEMPFWILPIVSIIPLIIIGFFIALPIGNMAHLGGLIFGMAYGWYLRVKYKKKIKIIEQTFYR